MTGYARVSGKASGTSLTVEAKSVNHRYLDLKCKLPREMAALENKVAELAKKYFARGRVEVYAAAEPGEAPVSVAWNRPLARGCAEAMAEMKRELGLAGEPDLGFIANLKDVIIVGDPSRMGDEAWPELAAVFESCFGELREMRSREGEALERDMIERLASIESWVLELEAMAPRVVRSHREKLERRLSDLLPEGAAVSEDRLAQEVAILADRADITEEMVRLKSHLEQFRAVLAEEGPVGRKLDFMTQEIFREINTSGNKIMDADAQAVTVKVKAELEKIREQVQNIE